MGRASMLVISGLFVALAGSPAFAACPAGKGEGDTWCENGYKWKCERCGSEYCSIIQSGSCHKDDEAPQALGKGARLDLLHLLKPASATPASQFARSPRP